MVPTIQSDWGWWLKRYPDTVAYHLYAKDKPEDVPAKPNTSSLKSRLEADSRLPSDDRVLGVVHGKHARAYRIADLKKVKVLRDKLGDFEVYVLYHEKTGTAAAYRPLARLEEQGKGVVKTTANIVGLELDASTVDAPFIERRGKAFRRHSSFDIAGQCVAGELRGWALDWVDSVEVKWFAWAAEYPETTVHGK